MEKGIQQLTFFMEAHPLPSTQFDVYATGSNQNNLEGKLTLSAALLEGERKYDFEEKQVRRTLVNLE